MTIIALSPGAFYAVAGVYRSGSTELATAFANAVAPLSGCAAMGGSVGAARAWGARHDPVMHETCAAVADFLTALHVYAGVLHQVGQNYALADHYSHRQPGRSPVFPADPPPLAVRPLTIPDSVGKFGNGLQDSGIGVVARLRSPAPDSDSTKLEMAAAAWVNAGQVFASAGSLIQQAECQLAGTNLPEMALISADIQRLHRVAHTLEKTCGALASDCRAHRKALATLRGAGIAPQLSSLATDLGSTAQVGEDPASAYVRFTGHVRQDVAAVNRCASAISGVIAGWNPSIVPLDIHEVQAARAQLGRILGLERAVLAPAAASPQARMSLAASATSPPDQAEVKRPVVPGGGGGGGGTPGVGGGSAGGGSGRPPPARSPNEQPQAKPRTEAPNGEMLGKSGVQVTSKTVDHARTGTYWRIDVENPAPGGRPGQLHLQDAGNKNKYYYNFHTKTFEGAPKSYVDQIMKDPKFAAAIAKGGALLGVPS